jgi:ribosomal protein S18 acetylase RimI-like enzyme
MGRNNADFEGSREKESGFSLSFDRGTSSYPHQILATTAGGTMAGYLHWNADTGRIDEVHVEPEHRRKGLATQMYRAALSSGEPIVHSAQRTDSGDAWAQSLDEPLPKREHWEH